MHPYIYVIPAGDSAAADGRRQDEASSIIHGIGPILMPGGMLILGGPDAKRTTRFIVDVSKHLKQESLKGIVVLVVSEPSEKEVVTNALNSRGATTRFVAM